MGFLLQLKLLLWKNITLKKRKPVMLILELTVPLVLFFILIAIRNKKPEVQYPAEQFGTWPLPSSGLVPILQSFCDDREQEHLDPYGFPTYPKATVSDMLLQLKTVAENNNFFEPGFSLAELSLIPSNYKHLIEDPLSIKELFKNKNIENDWKLFHFLENPNSTHSFLAQNNLFHSTGINYLIFNATINKEALFSLLFPPSIPEIFLNEHFSTNNSDVDAMLKAQDFKSNYNFSQINEGLFFYSLNKNKSLVNIVKELVLKNNSEIGIPGEITQLIFVLKLFLIDPNITEEYLCHFSNYAPIITCDVNSALFEECSNHLKKIRQTYCNLNARDKLEILQHFFQEVKVDKVANSMNGSEWDSSQLKLRIHNLNLNLKTFLVFKKTVYALAKLSSALPTDYCSFEEDSHKNFKSANLSISENQIESGKATVNNGSIPQIKEKISAPHPFSRIWKSWQKTICGKEYTYNVDEVSTLYEMGLSERQISRVEVLNHMLFSNPKILYAPIGTAADAIVKEANSTFELFDKVNQYSKLIYKVGVEMNEYLRLETTNRDLKSLSFVQTHLKHSSLFSLLSDEVYVREFIEEDQAIERDNFVGKLETISNASCSWNSLMKGVSVNIFQGYNTEDELIEYFQKRAYAENASVVAGVIFQMNNDGSLPNHMIYKIRQNATLVPDTSRTRARFWFPGPRTCCQHYYQFGFAYIQDTLERAMINLYSERNVTSPGTYVQQFPYPCYIRDVFLFMIQHTMPLCLTVSWVYSVAMLVQHIVYEKEKHLKEYMKMMGLKNKVHWIAWFISALAQMTISVIVLTLLLKYGKVLKYSNAWLVFFTMEAYAVTIIMFSFLVSVLYSKAKIAAACAGIVYFMSYIPYMYISVREETANEVIPRWIKASASLLAPTAFGLGAKYFAFYEVIGVGVQWSNFSKSPAEDDEFNLLDVIKMFGLDSFIYGVLVWYIENVHPGTIGIPKPWYFPIQKSYWVKGQNRGANDNVGMLTHCKWWTNFCKKSADDEGELDHSMTNLCTENDYFENDPINLPLGVSIVKLSKRYKGSVKYALKDLSINFYEGQITAILGHNGAGKSTTISILTGLFPATSGSAKIYEFDILGKMDCIRNGYLGMCPQHNVLFDDLTLDEHMWFYSRLRGHVKDEFDLETEKLIAELKLPHKRYQKVGSLSGGLKRKLSVALAFVGGSKTVILDEPTAGVDPYARRAIWDLIIKYKKGRTIMLTTHHMDEADILGDRIAILDDSRLVCSGSPLYLKRHLGKGYHISIVKKIENSEFFSHCTKDKISSFILQRIPRAKFTRESKHELHFVLPLSELHAGHFETLFKDLEEQKDELSISSYGIKSTTLEEIFLKVIERRGSNSSTYTDSPTPNSQSVMENLNYVNSNPNEGENQLLNSGAEGDLSRPQTSSHETQLKNVLKSEYKIITGKLLLAEQFRAIFMKRFLCAIKNKEGILTQIILPVFFLSVAMAVALAAPKVLDLPELILSPSQYYNLTQPYGNVIPFANVYRDQHDIREDNEVGSDELVRTLFLPSGIGSTCVLRTPFEKSLQMSYGDLNANLNSSHFDSMCLTVFRPGVPQLNFVPIPPTVSYNTTTHGGNNTKMSNNFEHISLSNKRKYPICNCNQEKTGFICPSYGYTNPNFFRVVTNDVLVDISGQNESQYYLYTTDMYRLRRYGGLSFGHVRDIIPNTFEKNSPSLFRTIAVRKAAKVWYNNKGYHSLATYLNVMNNAILRANLPLKKGNPSAYGITLINHPLPDTRSYFSYDEVLQGNDVLIAIFIIVAMSFVPASFVLYLVYEKSTNSKHLQIISGVHRGVYWVANYIWDICSYTVPATFCIIILLIFDIPAYTSTKNLPAVISLFFMYGWSIAPVMYPASFLFNEPSTAYIFMIVLNLFMGITCLVTSFLLQAFSAEEPLLGEVYFYLKTILLIFPNYSLGRGLMDVAFNEYYNVFYQKSGQYHKIQSPFAWDIVTRNLVIMACTGIFFFILTLLLEFKVFNIQRKLSSNDSTNEEEDEDVSAERSRILTNKNSSDILTVKNLVKIYSSRRTGNLCAVNSLCFGVPSGECFGLLGVNGAGKSTTFRMLTGKTCISSGDAFIQNHSVKHERNLTHKFIGYCPQFDALYEELSPKEHLTLYARLRGVPRKEIECVVDWALKKLDLVTYANKATGTLSGGNKRKVSTAIALIGGPSLIFLDEPTTGMDPHSKRFLWDLIQSLVHEGRSIVFTSHSMEECEALCTRLAIMVNGKFKCLGSTQHLKDKFGDGYSITIKSKVDRDTARLHKSFRKLFPFAKLKEKHHNSLHYELKSQYVHLDEIFRKMELAVKEINIQDYSVSQNTLDNVFINFVKTQHDGNQADFENFSQHERMTSDMSNQIQLEHINPQRNTSENTHV